MDRPTDYQVETLDNNNPRIGDIVASRGSYRTREIGNFDALRRWASDIHNSTPIGAVGTAWAKMQQNLPDVKAIYDAYKGKGYQDKMTFYGYTDSNGTQLHVLLRVRVVNDREAPPSVIWTWLY